MKTLLRRIKSFWIRFWMLFAGLGPFGRLATRLATWFAPPYKARVYMARLSKKGYIAPGATLYHSELRLGAHVFIGDRVIIYQAKNGAFVELGEGVSLFGDTIFETGEGGSITLGAHTHIQRGCQLVAYKAPIRIGCHVEIAQNCAFYPYDHGIAPGKPILEQPLQTRGPIVIEDHAWLGVGVIVLTGVRIGRGAVIGAGSVVTHDVPDGAIAVGVPARVAKMRDDFAQKEIMDRR